MVYEGDRVEVCPEAVDDSQNETFYGERQPLLGRKKSATSLRDPGPPPDGGIRAWTQVLVGHLIVMNTWYVPLTDRNLAFILILAQGQHKLVRYLSDFLYRLPRSLSRRCIVDRKRAGLPGVLHWYILRPSYRCRIFSPGLL